MRRVNWQPSGPRRGSPPDHYRYRRSGPPTGLVTEGLLIAAHGPNGGYRLARHPGDISLLDIVEAAEGPATFDHCVLHDGPCDWNETCPVHDTWARTQNALIQELAATSLADITAIDALIESGSYRPAAPPHSQHTDRHGNRN